MTRRARGSRGRALAAALVATCLAAAGSLVIVATTGSSSTSTSEDVLLPAPPAPAFSIPEPRPLGSLRDGARWSTVIRPANVRNAPQRDARVVASVETQTPEGTTNVVLVEARAEDADGALWMAVRVPALPRNVVGWVPRDALGASEFVRTRFVVDLEGLTATLLEGGRPIFRAEIGVGQPQWPTPSGEFYIRSRIESLSPFYGPLAFGTSARSAVLTDWPDGGFVGIHGTNAPELLPGRVSHGCIRMRNDDIVRLGRLMPVGTPLSIH